MIKLSIETNSSNKKLTNFRFALIGTSLFIALSAWAVSSPVASSPDDDFHLGSIWCADGLNTQGCSAEGEIIDEYKTLVMIPSIGAPCFAGNPGASAECQGALLQQAEQQSFANTGLYPSAFYKFQNLFISDQGAESVLRMRLANVLLFVVFFMLALRLSTRTNGLLLALTFVLTSVPMGMFIIPSNNPSSWLYMAILVNWAFQVVLLSPRNLYSNRAFLIAALAMLASGIMIIESRSDGKIYLLFSIGLIYSLMARQIKSIGVWKHLIPVFLSALALYKFYSDTPFSGFGPAGGGQDMESGRYLFTTLFRSIEIPLGNLGFLAPGGSLGILGWLDTPIPAIVPLITIGLLFSWTFLLYKSGSKGKKAAFFIASALLVLVPTYLLNSGRNLVGEYVQPRYVITLLPLFFISAVGINRKFTSAQNVMSKRLTFTAFVIAIANGVSLMANLTRYTFGAEYQFRFNLNQEPLWWWPHFLPPTVVLILGFSSYLMFTCILLIGSKLGTRSDGA